MTGFLIGCGLLWFVIWLSEVDNGIEQCSVIVCVMYIHVFAPLHYQRLGDSTHDL